MEILSNPEIWISLITLTVLEIVLGIDNIIFISILSGKLPLAQQKKARQLIGFSDVYKGAFAIVIKLHHEANYAVV